MLPELTIQDFAIIDEMHLRFDPGFNVLTGETGAGKSIIIDAVSLLLGGRGEADFVRTGADRATVEGIFALDEETQAAHQTRCWSRRGWRATIAALLVLAREIRARGATSAGSTAGRWRSRCWRKSASTWWTSTARPSTCR